MRAPGGAASESRERGRECERERGRRPGLARPRSLGRAPGPRGSSGSRLWALRRRSATTLASPSLRGSPFSRASGGAGLPPPAPDGAEQGVKGAAADRSSGSPAAKAPRRGGEDERRGRRLSARGGFQGPRGRSFPAPGSPGAAAPTPGAGSPGDRDRAGRGAGVRVLGQGSAGPDGGPRGPAGRPRAPSLRRGARPD